MRPWLDTHRRLQFKHYHKHNTTKKYPAAKSHIQTKCQTIKNKIVM